MKRVGEPTELALRVMAEKLGLPFPPPAGQGGSQTEGGLHGLACNQAWASRYERLGLLEFTRDRRMMSVLVKESQMTVHEAIGVGKRRIGTGACAIYTKGAPESVIQV